MAALKEQILACLMTAEGAPSPARMPTGSLATPRFPMGSSDTVIASSSSLPVPVRRVRLRTAAVVGGVLLAAFALVGVRFLREQPGPLLPPAETIAVGDTPSAKSATRSATPSEPKLPASQTLPTSRAGDRRRRADARRGRDPAEESAGGLLPPSGGG